MLSVILYGRNDNHGYNLHKRAAISLNAIAHLLNDPDDEIVFVDYNTPDDLPTFPEAIADTLTAKAIEKLRVLRVRPQVHQERFAARTHLNALEPIARNVAIRRSNPANKWILSTNTDMIFVPRHPGDDLTSAIGGLADGFYHLPRFELPEGLWETLDRKDAEGMIERTKEWGERFHLNEIIHSGNDNLYDGPGDFQLFLREDLFAIQGFHEEMIRGWHLDANVAKRMRLLRGKVSSALDRLVGYHCDHTRQATAYHKGDRIENNAVLYVDNIFEPQTRSQAETWGLPDVEIEELKLGQASGARYLHALETMVKGRLEGFLEAHYVPEAHGNLFYDPAHVLPYLLDLVSCIPQGTRIGYVGARRDMFEAFAGAWAAMGATTPVQVPDTAPWLADTGKGVTLPLTDWWEQTDLFMFEIGAETAANQSDLTREEHERLWTVEYAFKQATENDRARQREGAAPRRALVINGVHNFFETQVFAAVSVTLTPYSSRIRHGYFMDVARNRTQAAPEAERRAAAALGRLQPFNKDEAAGIDALTANLKAGADDRTWADAGRMAAEINALADAGVKTIFQGAGRPTPELLDRVIAERPSRKVKAAAPLIAEDAGRGAATRLARLEDFQDPDWVRLARWLFPLRPMDRLAEHNRWVWERVTLGQNVMAGRAVGDRPQVLIACAIGEPFAYSLGGLGCDIDIVNPASLKNGGLEAADWRPHLATEAWMTAGPLRLAGERAAAIADGFRYDAVLICQNALFEHGREVAGPLLRHATRLLRTGGQLGFTATVQLLEDEEKRPFTTMHPGLVRGEKLAQALEALVNLQSAGGADMRMTPRSFDTLAESDFPPVGPPALVRGASPHLEASAVFALTKGEGADEGDWDAVETVFATGAYFGGVRSQPRPTAAATGAAAPSATAKGGRIFTAEEVAALAPVLGQRHEAHYGPIFHRLEAREGVSRTPMFLRVTADLGEELAATASFGELPAGGYELVVEGTVRKQPRPGEVFAIGVVGAGRLLAEHVESADAAGLIRAVVPFDVDAETVGAPGGPRLGLKGLGLADFEVSGLVLR